LEGQAIRREKLLSLTLHHPSNVDNPNKLKEILDAILEGTSNASVVFPVHPRTLHQLQLLHFSNPRLLQIDPLGYLQFIYMLKHARAIITDSASITEEATVLDIPCMTLRNSTERTETITTGSNELVGTEVSNLVPYLERLQAGE
jgi:UDP-N-acetylglucosamine 2-epimerase (non-hydrolysing)